jgi:hypothetical protein
VRRAARSLDENFADVLPQHVRVVRAHDATGRAGFAPVDVRGASLSARALSVLLADYLMRPHDYVDFRAA